MKFWYYSLWTSLVSLAILLIMSVLPNSYNAFSPSPLPADAVIKHSPFMCVCWIIALIAIAMNNVFVDKCYINYNIKLPLTRKYLPSLLSLLPLFSFAWFCVRYFKYI